MRKAMILKLGGTAAISQYDRVAVTGSATLGGTLTVGVANNFVPGPRNNFSVLTTTGPISGTFATTNIAPVGITQPPTYNANSVVLVSP